MTKVYSIKKGNQTKIEFVLVLFLIIFLSMEIFALNIESHYKFDIPMCAALLIFMYRFSSSLYLHWMHYLLFSLFLWAHCLGMYELYKNYPLGIEYDYWMHGIFGFIFALFMLRWLGMSGFKLSKTIRISSTFIAILGVSAAHELYEFAGAIFLGSGEGVLFIGAGDLDQWDTQKDMLNNVVGGIFGIFISLVFNSDEIAASQIQHE